jgi:acetaldehyde dehydrogenase (acetylating)
MKNAEPEKEASEAVESAHLASLVLAKFDQAKIDRICESMAKAALSEAARLGQMAHQETGFGKPEDKYEKNRFAAEDVWNHFKNLKTVGVISDKGSVVEIASPRGVVAAIIPSTNPTSTAIFKIIIAIKSRNTIVLSPHPAAVRCIAETARVMKEVAVKEGLPPDAIHCLTNPTIQATETLMKHKQTKVILATGGLGLVRAAYSSGKPAFGVGPGNVPVYIEKTADLEKAVSDILIGTCFDNGTICASEQSVVVEASIAKKVREEFRRQGAHFLSQDEADKVAKVLVTEQRTLNPKIVGKSAEYIANLAGISIPPNTRCLIADCAGVGRDYPWSIEKLSPTLAFFIVEDFEKAALRCLEVLNFGGMGHTVGMHTRDRNAAIAFAELMPAARVCINTPTTHGAIGFSTDLPPSMTLGCGSWGGNVTSDNISPIHLLDVKRVAFETRPVSKKVEPVGKKFESVQVQKAKPHISREEIAAIVDNFLAKKFSDIIEKKIEETTQQGLAQSESLAKKSQSSESPVKTIIHELKVPEKQENGRKAMDFVSETDVRNAIERKEKIYIHSKTIITPAARDLGEEKDIFVKT